MAWLLVLWAGPALAQQYYFQNYTGDDGLSQLGVQVAMQDDEGYLWLGTQAGLNRYDGDRFEVFGIRQGLASDWINALVQDDAGRLWVGTNNGLSLFLPPDSFHTFTEKHGLPHKQVLALSTDRAGRLWIGTGDGLVRREESGFVRVSDIPVGRISALLSDRQGTLWVGTVRGLYYQEGPRFIRSGAVPEAPVYELEEDRDGRLWVGVGERLVMLDKGRPVASYGPAEGLRDLPVRALEAGRDGTIWVGTISGIAAIEGERIRFIGPENGLPFGGVSALLEDHEGRLWVGGYGGVAKFAGRAFVTYRMNDGLASNNVRPVLRGAEGDLWVGTQGGLNRFDGHRWVTYTEADGLNSAFVRSLLLDHRGRLWIGTHRGLSYREGGRFHQVTGFPVVGSVVGLAEDAEHRIWVSVQNVGVFRQGPDGFERVKVPGQAFTNARFLLDRKGRFWVSGNHGLSRWDGQAWRTFTVEDGLATNEPYFMAEDHRGRIWFGYHASYGITVHDGQSFQTYTTEDGLFHDAVYSIGVDGWNNLWIGTARGVDRFDGERFINYGPAEGYASNESNAGGFFADHDGTLWFGTANGLSHYFPQYDLSFGEPPLLRIQRLSLGDEEVPAGPSTRVPYARRDLFARIAVLSFGNPNKLHLRYRLSGYDDAWKPLVGREIRFTNLPAGAYTLEVQGRKAGSGWSVPVMRSFEIRPPFWQAWWFLLLLSLGAGLLGWAFYKYRLYQMAAHNRNLTRLVEERTAALRAQKAHLEETLDELTRVKEDLEEANRKLVEASRLKGEFLANMSHEIRTPMNGVIGMAELLLQTPLAPEQREYVGAINRCGEALLSVINDILDLSKIEAGRLELETVDFDLQEVVEDCVEFLAPRATAKELELVCFIQEEGTAVQGDPHRLRQVVMNLLGNAIKFTEKGEVVVRAHVIASSRRYVQWQISVKDTGIGISPEGQARLFQSFSQVDGSMTRRYGGTGLGLAISKQLVEMMGGAIEVKSEEGKGSTFSFTVRLKRQGAVPRSTRRPDVLSGRRVLVLAGNESSRKILEWQTQSWGLHPATVASGEEALSLVREQGAEGDPFEAVVLDGSLPEGPQWIRQLRAAAGAGLRFLWVAARHDEEAHSLAREAGVQVILYKPVRQSALFSGLVELFRGGKRDACAASAQGEPKPFRQASPEERPPAPPTRSERILVAEDNPVNQKVAVHHLQKLGYRVEVVPNGRAALEAVQQGGFHLVLMDIQMPEMDGFSATAEIRAWEQREERERLPIVAMTANAMAGERERCLEGGMDDYIAKPFKQKELAALLARWLGVRPRPSRGGEKMV